MLQGNPTRRIGTQPHCIAVFIIPPPIRFKGHCLVEHLLGGSASVKRLVRSVVIVVMSEPSQPAPSAGLTAPPERVKAVDSHGHCLIRSFVTLYCSRITES
jgi:hypothetical protein